MAHGLVYTKSRAPLSYVTVANASNYLVSFEREKERDTRSE